MFEKADAKVIILIMLMAIILAVTAALAYFYLINRPEYPDGTYQTTIEGQVILVESDPELAARIISTPVAEQPVAPVITIPPDGQGGGEDGGEVDMDSVLRKLDSRRVALTDAMALEGLDVEEDDAEEERRLERDLKLPTWFPGQGGDEGTQGMGMEQPAAKKAKL